MVGPRLLLLPGVAAVVRDASERVLFMHRADDGRWGLPAGAIDPGESPAGRAVKRRFTNIWKNEGDAWRLYWRHANVIPSR